MPRKSIPKAVKDAVLVDIKTGDDVKEIAARHGVSQSTVFRFKSLNKQAKKVAEKIVEQAKEPEPDPTEEMAMLRDEIDRLNDQVTDLRITLRTVIGTMRI